MTKEQKESIEKTKRAKIALFDTEPNGALYLAWQVVVEKSKEFAEMALNTPLAD